MKEKYQNLLDSIGPFGRVTVAFSGGVDSTFLVWAAAEALGRDNVFCITARAASFPERELIETVEFCKRHSLRHEILDFDEFDIPGFSENPPDRCYLCKRELFSRIISIAENKGFQTILEGSNADDGSDFRPGMKAIEELGIRSPLRDAGFTKEEIRRLSREFGLPTWSKPSFACLASRFAYGEKITKEKLEMVGAAEQFLLEKGFNSVRVRIHGSETFIARIELNPKDIPKLAADKIRGETAAYLKKLGFTYAALDLSGYRTGSMNEVL